MNTTLTGSHPKQLRYYDPVINKWSSFSMPIKGASRISGIIDGKIYAFDEIRIDVIELQWTVF